MNFLLFLFVGQCLCLYRESEIILKVNSDNYEDYVESEAKPIILHAYSPLSQQCKDVAGQFMKAAEELKEITKFACLQIDREKQLAHELGIKKPNTFFIVRRGQLQQFSGPITAKHIVSLVMNQVLANLDAVEDVGFQYFFKNVIQLNDENFDDSIMKDNKPWMVLFYSPSVPESKHMIPIWYDAAQNLKNKVNFGSVDVSNNPSLAKEYDVAGYPTGILLIQEATFYLHYNVHLNPDFITEWINNKMSEYDEDSLVNQLITQDRYEKCLEKPLCIIVFLPHILDCRSKCRTNLLNTLTDVYDKYKGYKWGWLWCESSSQGDLERSLDIDGFNIPTAVALNAKKMKYTTLRGPFDFLHMDDFLQDILMMKIPSSNLKKSIRIYATDLWDGKDPKEHKNHLDYFDVGVAVKDEL
ncbi:protein disulfide-isomerase A6 homolog [Coccinella septempunctata]|uniref:protein disulfide-isomerase A6 homolog n=1 Tax=Coccinella septempunctata TaxID=41139 RepID=UPI001D071F32|nr:protein disulfide-isomerase A6 homolog [Coccinella septempunctata]